MRRSLRGRDAALARSDAGIREVGKADGSAAAARALRKGRRPLIFHRRASTLTWSTCGGMAGRPLSLVKSRRDHDLSEARRVLDARGKRLHERAGELSGVKGFASRRIIVLPWRGILCEILFA